MYNKLVNIAQPNHPKLGWKMPNTVETDFVVARDINNMLFCYLCLWW